MTFAEALASAEAQYQQQRAAYVTSLSPERLEAIQRNAAKPRPTGRRIAEIIDENMTQASAEALIKELIGRYHL